MKVQVLIASLVFANVAFAQGRCIQFEQGQRACVGDTVHFHTPSGPNSHWNDSFFYGSELIGITSSNDKPNTAYIRSGNRFLTVNVSQLHFNLSSFEGIKKNEIVYPEGFARGAKVVAFNPSDRTIIVQSLNNNGLYIVAMSQIGVNNDIRYDPPKNVPKRALE